MIEKKELLEWANDLVDEWWHIHNRDAVCSAVEELCELGVSVDKAKDIVAGILFAGFDEHGN